MHFDDFKIVHGPEEREFLSLFQILGSTALQYKMENVPPNLSGAVVTSILDGSPYPQSLLQQCIRRIRAEVARKGPNGNSIPNVNRARAAILKAYINRFTRIHNPLAKEVTVSLDKTNTNPGYLLGRLFAVLEHAQNVANNYKEPNAGIRDRFYGAFSSSPITVYPLLEKLYGHHLGKIESKGYFQRLKGEIIDKLDVNNIPAHLSMEEQARFAIGYYHQRQDFYKKKSNGSEQQTTTSEEGDLK
jgi:CRISPR-associated protein Csd1